MIALIIKALSAIGLTDKAAKIAAPFVLGGVILAALWSYGAYQFKEGKEAAALASERALNDDLQSRFNTYLAAAERNQSAYEGFLNAITAIRTQAPQVIREIRDAPATECSNLPISDDEWLRLRRAYALRPALDAEGGG